MKETTQMINDLDTTIPAAEETPAIEVFQIAGFWKRSLAGFVDGIIISIPLLIFAFVFRNIGYALGPYGRIVGYTVTISYWAFYNSTYRNGQTKGKKLFKIAVVDGEGNPLTLRKSFLRAAILGVIALFNGWAIPIFQNPIVAFFVTIVVFGGGSSLFYSFIFNRTTRQGIHDLAVNSYVVQLSTSMSDAVPPEFPKLHQWIMYGIFGLSVLLAIVGLFPSITSFGDATLTTELEEVRQLQMILERREDIHTAGVSRVTRTSFSSGSMLQDLNIEVWAKTPCRNGDSYCDDLLKEIAQIAFAEYDGIETLDGMKISVVNRVDFGIATINRVQGIEYSMEDWQAYLND
jgi:uncharacterized RDD family membrane protein YckC